MMRLSTDLSHSQKLNYLTNGYTLKSWLLTKDHKRIAIMYLITVSVFFFDRRALCGERSGLNC